MVKTAARQLCIGHTKVKCILTCKVAASKLAEALLAARESRQEDDARSDSARSASMFCAISAPVFLQSQRRIQPSSGDRHDHHVEPETWQQSRTATINT